MNDRSTEQTQRQDSVRETVDDSRSHATDVRSRQTGSDIGDGREMRDDREDTGFLPPEKMETLREKWSDVQASFVDDPRSAVQEAHGLVTQIVNDLTDTFTRERSNLESQWSGGGEGDTEALRIALQRYRSFFNRLLGTTSETQP